MVSDSLKLTGKLKVQKFNQDNNLVEIREIPNLVVSVGKSHIATRISANNEVIMNHMAIGGSATSPAASDTSLGSELGRVGLTSTSVTANTLTYLGTFSPGTGTGTVKEAGIFNAQGSGAGTMLCRTTFADINKGASDSIVITWNVSVA
tara:strand:- start:3031 stop:3477 length:447 start_codon:yes stop_codon:yes gene_type:complete